jgi:hypothetical protein
MVNAIVAACVLAPALPVIVITYWPGAIDGAAETVRIELKLGAPDVGFSDVDMPLGTDTVRITF